LTHHCDKEKELAEMHSDIKYIVRQLRGNGSPGLVEQVRCNTEHRISSESRAKLIFSAVGTGWLITLLVAVLGIWYGA